MPVSTLQLRALAPAAIAAALCLGLALVAAPARAQLAAPDSVATAPPEVLARNKRHVIDFYDLAFNKGRPREAVERYMGEKFVQHDPEVPDGRDGFVWYFERLARDYPDRRLVIRRVFAEGQHVVVHGGFELPAWLGSHTYAVIGIFRLDDNGRIVEHWNATQRIPERNSTNLNPML